MEGYGIEFIPNRSHITAVPVRDAVKCRTVANELLSKQGVYLQPINFPTVPKGEECLRIIITARHQLKHTNHLAYSLNKILNGNDQDNRKGIQAFAVTDGTGEAED